jgi:transposase
MAKKYIINLSEEERHYLRELTTKGQTKARRLRRARTLLLAGEGHADSFVAQALGCGIATVERTRARCVEEGLEAALSERARPGAERKLTGKEEALLVALACSEAPEGVQRWTMQLLADKVVELTGHETLSRETVRRTLKKTGTSPG